MDMAIQRCGQPDRVGHHQKAAAGLRDEVAGKRQHVVGGGFIEIAGGLVRKQEQRLDRQRPPDCDPLLLAAGQLFGIAGEEAAPPAKPLSPPSARSSPATRCNSVLLPLPDSPVSATRSPAAISKLTPRRTATRSPAAE